MGIRLHVWGEWACFTRPEMKVERVSYDVMTPSAARGIVEAIYWKPEIRWVIDRIHVLAPIRFTNLRRNEVGAKASAANTKKVMKAGRGDLGLYIEDERQQRAATILRDVAYVIEAHFDVIKGSDGPDKHYAMACRRARQGQCFTRPYLGCREFAADFALLEDGDPMPKAPAELAGERNLGFMLHDIDYQNDRQARFFRAVLHDGVLDVPAFDAAEVVR
jgi:CRISPR-associated protein Cas5d